MTVNSVQPDFTNQDATTYKSAIDASINANRELGVQFYCTEKATPSMKIDVEAGVLEDGTSIPTQEVTIATAPISDSRIDLIQLSREGVATVLSGDVSATPVPPEITPTNAPIALVNVSAGVIVIYGTNIDDARSSLNFSFEGTDGIPVSDKVNESLSGTATTQQIVNIESKSAINANSDAIENISGASLKVAQLNEPFVAGVELVFDFDTVTPSDTPAVLDADDTANTITLKKAGVRYKFATSLNVNSSGGGTKTIILRVYNAADDTLLSEREPIVVPSGTQIGLPFPLDAVFIDNPTDDLAIYFTAEGSSSNLTLNELNTIASAGSGGSDGVWTVQDNKITNIGGRAVEVNVPLTGVSVFKLEGTGTAYDTTYNDTGNPDGFGNPTLSDGVNTLIKNDTDEFWCIVSGITITNPDYTTSQYYNPLGQLNGTYTVVLGAGVDGIGTVLSGTGVPAIVANSETISPAQEITNKLVRKYNFDEGYIVDTMVEAETGATYVLVSNGVARLAIPVAGIGNAMNTMRSLFVGGNTDNDPNNAVDIDNTLFDKTFIPCDTDLNGADMGVAHNLQVINEILVGALKSNGFRILSSGATVGTATNYGVLLPSQLGINVGSDRTRLFHHKLQFSNDTDSKEIERVGDTISIEDAVSANTPAEIATLGVKAFQTEESIKAVPLGPITLLNGWITYAGAGMSIVRDMTGLVTITMMLDGSSATDNAIYQLPAGYIPAVTDLNLREVCATQSGTDTALVLVGGMVSSSFRGNWIQMNFTFRA